MDPQPLSWLEKLTRWERTGDFWRRVPCHIASASMRRLPRRCEEGPGVQSESLEHEAEHRRRPSLKQEQEAENNIWVRASRKEEESGATLEAEQWRTYCRAILSRWLANRQPSQPRGVRMANLPDCKTLDWSERVNLNACLREASETEGLGAPNPAPSP